MSNIDSVLERLRRAYAAIAEVRGVAARSPGDRFVLANLQALKSDADDLEQQWEQECRYAQIEVCRYRIIPENSHNYSLASVSKSLLDFQELFSQIYDALKRGTKKRGRVSATITAETKFDFGFTYPGSLGVALMVESTSNFWGSKFDEAVQAISGIISINDKDDVRELARSLGRAVVTKAYEWSKVNVVAGYGVDITWKRTDGTIRGGLVDVPSLEKVVDLITKTSDKTAKNITVKGVLVGINIKTKKFRFVERDGPDYIGTFADEFPLTKKWSVNTNYTADIIIEEIMKYATHDTKRSYELARLKR